MSLRINSLKKYRNELDFFKKEVDKIKINSIKKQGLSLISKLENEMKMIEQGHDSYYNGYINPVFLRDNISKSIDIRKKLHKLIKEIN